MNELFLSWLSFLSQFVFLIYPAYRLAGRDLPGTILWASVLLWLGSLAAIVFGSYAYKSALLFHSIILVFAFLWRRYFPAENQGRASSESFDRVFESGTPGSFALSISFWSLLVLAFYLNLLTPPAGFDALSYHLEFPLNWIQAGKIYPVPTGFGDLSPTYYPMLTGLFYGWFLLPGQGLLIADVAGLAWAPALYFVLRALILDSEDSYGGANSVSGEERNIVPPPDKWGVIGLEGTALLGATIPYLISQAQTAQNDLPLCVLLLLAFYYTRRLLITLRERSESIRTVLMERALPAGLACGFAAAVKYTALVYLGGILLYLLVFEFLRYRVRLRKLTGFAFLIFVVALVFAGGYWYLRNWRLSGNPLFPGEIGLFSFIVFPGYYPRSFFKSHPFYHFSFFAFFKDPAFLCLLVLYLGAPVLYFYSRGKDAIRRPGDFFPALFPTFLPLLLFFLFYLFIPLRHHRLVTPALIFIPPALAVLGRDLIQKDNLYGRIFGLGIIASIAVHLGVVALRYAELYGPVWDISLSLSDFSPGGIKTALQEYRSSAFLYAGLIALPVFWVTVFFPLYRRLENYRVLTLRITLGILALVLFFAPREQGYHTYARRAGELGRAWAWVEKNIQPEKRLALVGSNALVPLRGLKTNRRIFPLYSTFGGEMYVHNSPVLKSLMAKGLSGNPAKLVPRVKRSEFLDRLENFDVFLVTTVTGSAPPLWSAEWIWLNEEIKAGRSEWKKVYQSKTAERVEIYIKNKSLERDRIKI